MGNPTADLKYAKTDRRTRMKAESQRRRRAYIKKHGKNSLAGKDYDHTCNCFTTVKKNRGNRGNGTRGMAS